MRVLDDAGNVLSEPEPHPLQPPSAFFDTWPEYLWDEALRGSNAETWALSPEQEERFDRAVAEVFADPDHIATHNLRAAYQGVICAALASAGLPDALTANGRLVA
jgi:hypothetical protein